MEERRAPHLWGGWGVAWPRRSRMCKLCLLQEEEAQDILSPRHLCPLLLLRASSSALQFIRFLSLVWVFLLSVFSVLWVLFLLLSCAHAAPLFHFLMPFSMFCTDSFGVDSERPVDIDFNAPLCSLMPKGWSFISSSTSHKTEGSCELWLVLFYLYYKQDSPLSI